MNYDDLDERFKDVTFNHYVAHNNGDASPYKTYYYSVRSTIDISVLEVSAISDDWLKIGIIYLSDDKRLSIGDQLQVRPVNQNNMQSTRTKVYKNSKIKSKLIDDDFINQVYVNLYQENKLLLNLARNHSYYIEVKNVHDRDVYYNINLRIAEGS